MKGIQREMDLWNVNGSKSTERNSHHASWKLLMACWPQGYLENHSQLRWMFQGVFGCQHILGFITVSWFYLLFILFYKIFGWGGMWYDWKKNFNLVSHFSYWIFFMLLEIIINRVKYHSLWHLFNHEIE